ncbi:hypothetical protein ACFP7A_00740 [Sporolactobacillus kofuensis]|uniref:YopX protein domain-containing protein n=1 Tax=Sporolactobacillus kofuensis TaxID=269672 RepID=A0ABW1WCW4_9BACL|nr:hypothetical protein [Sporolactobacillus kofuensis]MCO7175571.1 hypothetical protein [Sporolactobacillus kofuensis]
MTTVLTNMSETIKKLADDLYYDYDVVGVRFEDKDRVIGEICENSRHNEDREDERDFPEYGTDEYEEMEELDGTCAWDTDCEFIRDIDNYSYSSFTTNHCYFIAGDYGRTNETGDVGEVVIKNAKVIAKLF